MCANLVFAFGRFSGPLCLVWIRTLHATSLAASSVLQGHGALEEGTWDLQVIFVASGGLLKEFAGVFCFFGVSPTGMILQENGHPPDVEW